MPFFFTFICFGFLSVGTNLQAFTFNEYLDILKSKKLETHELKVLCSKGLFRYLVSKLVLLYFQFRLCISP